MRIAPTVLSAALLLASNLAVAGARDDLNAFTKGLKGLDGQFSQQVFDVRRQAEGSLERPRGAVCAAPVPLGIHQALCRS